MTVKTIASPFGPKVRRFHQLENVNTKTFASREYQIELLDAVRSKNIIACIDSKSSKLFIVIMAIKELAHKLRNKNSNLKTVVLVPSDLPSHFNDYYQIIQDYTDLKVLKYFEETENSYLETPYQVLITSPYLAINMIANGKLSLDSINLLITDHCHLATENHPYFKLFQLLNNDFCSTTRILGFCGSLLSNVATPKQLCQRASLLEQTLHSSLITANDLTTISKYGNKPSEIMVFYDDFFCLDEEFEHIKDSLNETYAFLESKIIKADDDIDISLSELPKMYILETYRIFITLGPWCAKIATDLFLAEMSLKESKMTSPARKQLIYIVHTTLQMVSTLCVDIIKNRSNILLDSVSSKLTHLLSLLTRFENHVPLPVEEVPGTDDTHGLCGLVFVRQRITAYVISTWLSEVSKAHHPFLKPNFLVDISKPEAIQYRKEYVLQKFRSRECNLLIATYSMIEGLDVPKCNLSILFDEPSSFKSYLQSRGKAKVADSFYAIMISKHHQYTFWNVLTNFKMFEQILLDKCEDNEIPSKEELLPELVDHFKEPYQPIASPEHPNPPKVTLSSAIGLVNKYCAKLPSDTFTRLTPFWTIEKSTDGFRCTIQLPINSPLKHPIEGDPMPTKHLAKMAAALETNKRLHKAGELDDNLFPTGKESVKFEDDILVKEVVPPGSARPGTSKRRQYYYKQVASDLQASHPLPGKRSYLYNIRMELTCPIPEEQNTRGRKIHDPADHAQGFGILTSKPILPICAFPVFTRSGEATVHLEEDEKEYEFDEDQLEKLFNFHQFTFSNVLRLEKYPMIHSSTEAESSFYIVPVNKSSNEDLIIDWEFVLKINKHKNMALSKIPSQDRKDFLFREEDYEDAVVMPWYRNLDSLQFFYVAEICHNLTPESAFPDFEFPTFAAYYKGKYNIEVMNLSQPLLDVDHTSARLNLLTPRYVNRKGVTLPTSSEQTKKDKRENLQQKQILLPELCIIHPFPASLWRKAVCLPCILYRINSLLLAEELRYTVASEINVGLTQLPDNFKWPTLDFGWNLADVLKSQPQKYEVIKEEKEIVIPEDESLITRAEDYENPPPAADLNIDSLIIDMFDASKYKIPASSWEETTLSPPITIFPPIWKKPDLPEQNGDSTDQQMRCNSPSHFENTGWDLEREDEALFYNLDLPGLGYISAPGVFNMQGLSRDLASCREEEAWDSLDEDMFSDDNEEDPSQLSATQTKESYRSNIIHKKIPYISEWVLDCDCENKKAREEWDSNNLLILADSKETDLVEDQMEVYSSLCELKMKEVETIKSLDNSSSSMRERSVETHLDSLLNTYWKQLIINKNIEDKSSLSEESNGSQFLVESPHSNLPFGELLPDREKLQVENDESEIFRISFDHQPDLRTHPGPSPSLILQALTMSNANDGINLERLETVGDSFLKYAITTYLFCTYPYIHEGKLSYLRSKQISNLNLYALGKQKGLGSLMVATKFEPNDFNWLPPCYTLPKGLEQALIESGVPDGHWNLGKFDNLTQMTEEQIRKSVLENQTSKELGLVCPPVSNLNSSSQHYIPYNLLKQHSIPDKSIADCVEALIGCYLISCGIRGALLFMSWLGLKVLPTKVGADGKKQFVPLPPPPSPLLTHVPNYIEKLDNLVSGYTEFERSINYTFEDKSYLLQAFTHASYHHNRLTDCHQRLEFLGDAVLDYLITRHLYEDPQKHSPGILTDLRSALVNNTFFASLAVKYNFYKYFKAISPGLFSVINKFVEMRRNPQNKMEEIYLEEDECEETEEIEVPKALGDVFESVAGAIYLDSGLSLDTVWRVYYAMMKPEIEYFSAHVPKSPIRELLEMEPQTAKFERAEVTLNGKVRVKVEVFEKGSFIGIGRNKRIAKCTAAKRALRELKKNQKKKLNANV